MRALEQFRLLAAEERFRGWPLVGEVEEGVTIPYFGKTINYNLRTPKGVEPYTSIIRSFGWSMVFGVTGDGLVPTLCQWKPGVNRASWEIPPGGIGKLLSHASVENVREATASAYERETGYVGGVWSYLGWIDIETGKYRGAFPEDHGGKAHLWLAHDIVAGKTNGNQTPLQNEIMETIMIPLDEWPEVLESGLFNEESAVACAYRALVKLGHLTWKF